MRCLDTEVLEYRPSVSKTRMTSLPGGMDPTERKACIAVPEHDAEDEKNYINIGTRHHHSFLFVLTLLDSTNGHFVRTRSTIDHRDPTACALPCGLDSRSVVSSFFNFFTSGPRSGRFNCPSYSGLVSALFEDYRHMTVAKRLRIAPT